MSESFSTLPAQTVTPSYLYAQYSGDADLQAFVDAYNSITQGYLNWFNTTPLGLYTGPNINGLLLDWIGQGVYGVPRPVIGTFTTGATNALNTMPVNARAVNENLTTSSGTATVVNDDIYKRALTWRMYRGDGVQMSIPWVRRRVARFAFGAGGADIDIGLLPNVGITQSGSAMTITVATSPATQAMQSLISQGHLPLPFQMTYTVTLT